MEELITVTKDAAKRIGELAKEDKKENYGLKLFIFPGGCSGVQYGMDFAESPEKDDNVIEQHGIRIFIDKDSVSLVKGAKIDFANDRFSIDNPNSKCGGSCGSCH